MNNPTKENMQVVYRILIYIKGTFGEGLYIKKSKKRDVEVFTKVD